MEVVSWYRSKVYAQGISEGAPGAVQVADRWHLLRSLALVLEEFRLGRPYGSIEGPAEKRHKRLVEQWKHTRRLPLAGASVKDVGNRHRSAYRLAATMPDALVVVFSQDGNARFVADRDGAVTCWDQA